jgi:hypothetical protein
MTVSRLLLLPLALAACTDPAAPADAPEDTTTTITITTQQPAALVAFRDADGGWQPATSISPLVSEAHVHGPYVVTVVCDDPGRRVRLFQDARTLDDDHAITHSCARSHPDHTLTGHMVQAGEVNLGPAIELSVLPDWDFALAVPDGSYDLVATTDDRIAIQRGVSVSTDRALAPALDLVKDGRVLVPAHLTTTAAPSEEVSASVWLSTPTTRLSGVSHGPLDTARLVPEALLLDGDEQRVRVSAATGRASRSLERPYRAGADPVFTLPEPLVAELGLVDGAVTADWSALPAFDRLGISIIAFDDPGTKLYLYDLAATPGFVATTHRLALDTRIPGMQAAWQIDFTRPYSRGVFVERRLGDATATSSIDDDVSAATAARRVRLAR